MKRVGFLVALALLASPAACAGGPLRAQVNGPGDLHCRLPVTVPNAGKQQAGFIRFPAGSYSADPAHSEPVDTYARYDRPLRQWVEGSLLEDVSPDGTRAVWMDGGPIGSGPAGPSRPGFTRVVYFDLKTRQQTNGGTIPATVQAIAWRPEGIYVQTGGPGYRQTGLASGVYLFDPKTQTTRRMGPKQSVSAYWMLMADGSLWGYERLADGSMKLDSMSLGDGSVTAWEQTAKNVEPMAMGVVDGGLLAAEMTIGGPAMGTVTYAFLDSPRHRRSVSAPPGLKSSFGVTDSHGVWVAGGSEVWLFQPRKGFLELASVAGGGLVTVAGGCA